MLEYEFIFRLKEDYYEVDAKFEGYKLIFNDAEKPQRNLLPKSDGFTVEAGKTYDADSE